MSAELNNQIERRHYTAHSGDNILSQVGRVLCIVTADALISAGIHPSGEILMISSSSYSGGAWDTSFLEHELLNDPLLADPQLIRSIFPATLKNIIIPGELFPGEDIAPQWLQAIYYCEKTDKLRVQDLGKSKASCCYAYPAKVEECFGRFIKDVPVMPLNYVHFHNSVAAINLLQCTITDKYAVATLHHNRQLHWHQTFEYQTTEDIAYRLSAACRSFGIDPHSYPLLCTTTSDTLNKVASGVQDYFPDSRNSGKDVTALATAAEWAPVVYLFQQLNACVS